MKVIYRQWGLNLRTFRQVRGISSKDFAERLGVTVASLSRWETGATPPNDKHKFDIIDALEINDGRVIFPILRTQRDAA